MNVPISGFPLTFFRNSLCTLSLGAVMLTSSCKDESASETNETEETRPTARASTEELAALLNQKMALTKDLDRLLKKSPPADSLAFQKSHSDNREATLALGNIRRTHPKLKEIATEIMDWQSQLNTARSSNNFQEQERASQKLASLNKKMQEIAKELPEIKAAEQAVRDSGMKMIEVRRSLAGEIPEAASILKEIEEIEAKLKASTAR